MKRSSNEQGFTLIEMIVSLGVFSIVITISVGALLMLIATNQRLQTEQSVMTNLSFALDSMTREIRTGSNYYCVESTTPSGDFAAGQNIDTLHASPVQDCADGNSNNRNYQGISFKEGGDSITLSDDRILYYFDKPLGKIFRKVGAGTPESIVSSGIFIKNLEFFVTDTASLKVSSEQEQPVVTIFIEAAETTDATKNYKIQTTVTQRTLDL